MPHPERGVARGPLMPVRAASMRRQSLWRALPPWERYLARVHAVALCIPDVVFCPRVRRCTARDCRLRRSARRPRSRAAASRHRAADVGRPRHTRSGDRAIVEVGGLLVTSPAETAVDLARSPAPRDRARGRRMPRCGRIRTLTRRALVGDQREPRQQPRRRHRAVGAAPRDASRRDGSRVGEPGGHRVAGLRGARAAGRASASTATTIARLLLARGGLAGEADGDLKYDGRMATRADVLRTQSDRDRGSVDHVRAIAHWGWHDVAPISPAARHPLGAGCDRSARKLRALAHPERGRPATRRTAQHRAPETAARRTAGRRD